MTGDKIVGRIKSEIQSLIFNLQYSSIVTFCETVFPGKLLA